MAAGWRGRIGPSAGLKRLENVEKGDAAEREQS